MRPRLHIPGVVLAAVFLAVSLNLSASPFPQSKKLPPQADINAIGHRDVGKGPNLYLIDKEIALGKVLAQEVERSVKLIDDHMATDYVDRLCQSLAKNSDAHMPITIRVIDSDIPDGFTLPGGFLYINKGLILQAQTEAELAGALAHGIAHTALRSATKLATRGNLIQLASIPALIFVPSWVGGWVGYDQYANFNLVLPSPILKEVREDEYLADRFGLQYAYKSGYDAESFPLLIARVVPQNSPNKRVPKVFSFFPPVPDRIQAMQREINEVLPHREQDIVSSSEFEVIKERIRSLSPTNVKPILRKRSI